MRGQKQKKMTKQKFQYSTHKHTFIHKEKSSVSTHSRAKHDKTKSTKNNRCKTYYTIKITLGNNKKQYDRRINTHTHINKNNIDGEQENTNTHTHNGKCKDFGKKNVIFRNKTQN